MARPDAPDRDQHEIALSLREQEILELVAAGHSTPEVAAELGITPGTVKVHLTSIYRKLRVKNRVQAARYYADHVASRSKPRRR